jgi:hypothetical protein
VRFLLSSHSRIHVPDETGFIPFLRTPADKSLSRSQVKALLERIGRLNRFWRDLVEDDDGFYDALPEPRLRNVLDALYRIQIAEHGAARWGDKTPLYVRHMPYLDQVFPEASFIHVIRDGRDATVSALKKWSDRHPYLDPYYLLKNWTRNVGAGRESGGMLAGERYLEIRYEDLVHDVETTMRTVCTFLNERFEPEMLDQTVLARTVGGGIDRHLEVQSPITADSCGRWTSEMTAFEKKLADHVAGPMLQSLGYPLSGIGSFSVSEALRFGYLLGKFAVSDTARSLLYRTGLLTLNRNRRS